MGTIRQYEAGVKTARMLLERDPDHYKKMGRKGGAAKVKKGFATWSKEDLRELSLRNAEKRRKNG